VDRAGLRYYFEVTIFHFPFCGAVVFIEPLGEVVAIEERDGVGRSLASRILRACSPGSDDNRYGTVEIVNFPLCVLRAD
jgi:hypothetical protein